MRLEVTGILLSLSLFVNGCVPSSVASGTSNSSFQYYSVQNESGQIVPNNVWTTIYGYDTENVDIGGGASKIMAQGEPDFEVMEGGVYQFAVYVRWSSAGDAYAGQRLVRFIREHDTSQDHFGVDEHVASAGMTFHSHTYFAKLNKGRRVAVQVLQSSGKNLQVEFIQFKAVKIAG